MSEGTPPLDMEMERQGDIIPPPTSPVHLPPPASTLSPASRQSAGVPLPADFTPPDMPQTPTDTFVLAPVSPLPKRPRLRRQRHHLLIDTLTTISSQQLRDNIQVANERLTIRMRFPSLMESAESLLSRPASSIVPDGMRNRFKRLMTLPQPDDPLFVDDEPEEIAPPQLQESFVERVEQQRAQEGHEDTTGPSLSGILRSFSRTAGQDTPNTSLLPKDPTLSFPSLRMDQGPTIPVDDIDIRALIGEDLDAAPIEMQFDVEQFQDLEQHLVEMHEEPQEIRGESTMQAPPSAHRDEISPELTGPPPSPIGPFTPDLESTMNLLQQTAAKSMLPDATTFSALLENTHKTRKNVALQFNRILHLHKRGRIYVKQDVPYDEIFIQINSSRPF